MEFFNNDIKLLNWFRGFCDAEANFQVYPKKRLLKSGEVSKYNIGYGFHISLHKREENLIKLLHNNLNIGVVNISDSRNDARLAINDKKGIIKICNYFDEYPLYTLNQNIRFNLLKEFIYDDISEFNSLELFNNYKDEKLLLIKNKLINTSINSKDLDNWIIGFINGEGCFYLKNNKCNFIIEHTDKYALELIKTRLEFGPKVSERSLRLNSTKDKIRKPTFQLAISSKKDINTLIDFLDNNNNISLQGYKHIEYLD